MIDKILSELDVKAIAFNTTKGNHYTDDLTQEIILELLEMDRTKLIRLHESNELKRYVYKLAYISFNKYNGRFFKKYRTQHEVIENPGVSIELIEVLENANLTEMEWLWIKAYLDHDGCYTWMQSKIHISRQHIAKRIKEIAEKCRNSL